MPAELEVRLDSLLERLQPQLFEPMRLATRERVVEKIRERLAAEERERLAELLGA